MLQACSVVPRSPNLASNIEKLGVAWVRACVVEHADIQCKACVARNIN